MIDSWLIPLNFFNKNHNLGGFKPFHLFSYVSGDEKLKVMVMGKAGFF